MSLILYLTLGTAYTIFLDRDHSYNSVKHRTVTPGSVGSGYGNGTGAIENLYNAILGPNTMGQSNLRVTTVLTMN